MLFQVSGEYVSGQSFTLVFVGNVCPFLFSESLRLLCSPCLGLRWPWNAVFTGQRLFSPAFLLMTQAAVRFLCFLGTLPASLVNTFSTWVFVGAVQPQVGRQFPDTEYCSREES